jgi:hypothetical protein
MTHEIRMAYIIQKVAKKMNEEKYATEAYGAYKA